MNEKQYKLVYLTPALYMAGGVERVLTLKANYFAEQFGYEITIILTEGKNRSFLRFFSFRYLFHIALLKYNTNIFIFKDIQVN